jgi:hypothetical protein
MRTLTRICYALSLVMVLAICISVILYIWLPYYQVDSRYKRLLVGMSERQVLQIMGGQPTEEREVIPLLRRPGCTQAFWDFGHRYRVVVLFNRLSEDGRMEDAGIVGLAHGSWLEWFGF